MVLQDGHIPTALLCDSHEKISDENQPQQHERNKYMQNVVWDLSSNDMEVRLQAAREIRHLTKTSVRSRTYFAEAGAIAPLVCMLKLTSVELREAALLALLNLAVRHERNKMRIIKAGAITPLVELLNSEERDLRDSATAVLLTLSAAEANKKIIGSSGAIPLLVEMISLGSIQGKADAVITLHNLSTHSENRLQMLAANAGTALIVLLKGCKKSSKLAEKIMSLLEVLSKFEECRCSILTEAGGLLAIVEVLEEGSVEGREYAVGALLTMCESDRHKYREAILQEGAIPGLLELSVQGAASAREKSKKLLGLLRDPLHGQRSGSASPSGSPTLESIAYDIAARAANAGAGTEAAKTVLSAMVQLKR
ncbi:hypothetical protein KP509_17G025600 [Ceratopteris richardii]|uniref:U-box domain-containing protein n=1 Tax=Ceratopteris richardii TaxID=49495 RepID=A0A8T2SUW4_CERRI|nr:hypothetical protein KP509_17G025600 [Ceratopteris richardii]